MNGERRLTKPRTAVLVAALNAAETIGDQLKALSRQVGADDFEIVVIDNGSTDTTLDVVDRWTRKNPSIRRITAADMASAGYARNEGVRATDAELLLFTDSDDITTDTWVASMVDALDRYPMVGGSVEERSLNPAEVLAWTKERVNTLEVAHRFLPHAIGTNLGIRRDVFDAIGGWAESFPAAASEDIEISWRAQLAGYKLGSSVFSIVCYRHRHTLTTVARQYYRRGRNDQALCRAYSDFLRDGFKPHRDDDLAIVAIDTPRRRYSVPTVLAAIMRTLPKTVVSREARGAVVRAMASGTGWAVGTLLFKLSGQCPIGDELGGLLAEMTPRPREQEPQVSEAGSA